MEAGIPVPQAVRSRPASSLSEYRVIRQCREINLLDTASASIPATQRSAVLTQRGSTFSAPTTLPPPAYAYRDTSANSNTTPYLPANSFASSSISSQ